MDKDRIIEEIHESSSPNEKLSVIDKLRMLLDLTKQISRSHNTDEVLKQVMDTLGSLIRFDAAGIYLIESKMVNGHIELKFKSKVIRGYRISFDLIEPRLKIGEGFIGYVAETGESLIS
ncbi:MAG: hypothetical protein ACR2J3_07435, partial [Aridibacter sp.]